MDVTRPQYIALCLIGAVAALAYLEAQRVARQLKNMTTPAAAGQVSGGVA